MKRAVVMLALVYGVSFPSFAGKSDVEVIRRAIAYDLLNAKSREGRYACSTKNYACSGPAKSEMALRLLRYLPASESDPLIVDLSAFRLDSALAEDYSCLIADRMPLIRKKLNAGSARTVSDNCFGLFKKLISGSELYGELDPGSFCRAESDVKKRIEDLAKISKSSECD